MATKKTREQALNQLTTKLRPVFKKAGFPLPANIRMACSFTGHGARSRAIGQCWATTESKDEHFEIMISPVLDTWIHEGEGTDAKAPQGVAMVLAHELGHVAVGIEEGHGPEFKRCMTALGIGGKMTATTALPKFVKMVAPMAEKIGEYPHAEMFVNSRNGGGGGGGTGTVPKGVPRTSGPKKQGTRMIKVECPYCLYKLRTTRNWLESFGAPYCPCRVNDPGRKPGDVPEPMTIDSSAGIECKRAQ